MRRSLLPLIFALFIIFSVPAVVSAEDVVTAPDCSTLPGLKKSKCLAEQAAGQGGYATAEAATNIPTILGTIVNSFLGLIGIIFLLLTIYGGYTWMTAQGGEEEVKKAKGMITNAVIGLAVVMGAWVIYGFIGGTLGL